eukprot:5307359-Alexandrium_andersonii.AAC.1
MAPGGPPTFPSPRQLWHVVAKRGEYEVAAATKVAVATLNAPGVVGRRECARGVQQRTLEMWCGCATGVEIHAWRRD